MICWRRVTNMNSAGREDELFIGWVKIYSECCAGSHSQLRGLRAAAVLVIPEVCARSPPINVPVPPRSSTDWMKQTDCLQSATGSGATDTSAESVRTSEIFFPLFCILQNWIVSLYSIWFNIIFQKKVLRVYVAKVSCRNWSLFAFLFTVCRWLQSSRCWLWTKRLQSHPPCIWRPWFRSPGVK